MAETPEDKALRERASKFCDAAGNKAGNTAKAASSFLTAGAAAMGALPVGGPFPAALAGEAAYDAASGSQTVQTIGNAVDNAVSTTCRNAMVLPPKPK